MAVVNAYLRVRASVPALVLPQLLSVCIPVLLTVFS